MAAPVAMNRKRSLIIDRGRGPEIDGTRITVWNVLDYVLLGWDVDRIAGLFSITPEQIKAAMKYIADHTEDVLGEYVKMLKREREGNPPELVKKRQASRAKLMAERKRLKSVKAKR